MLMYEPKAVNNVKLDYCHETKGIPEPFQIIDEQEWRAIRHQWAVHYYQHEKITDKEQLIKIFGIDVCKASAYIEHFGDYGVAEIVECYKEKPLVKYVRIGCKHQWQTIDRDKFSEVLKCKLCGTTIEIPQGD